MHVFHDINLPIFAHKCTHVIYTYVFTQILYKNIICTYEMKLISIYVNCQGVVHILNIHRSNV